jgi:hypothetical protein
LTIVDRYLDHLFAGAVRAFNAMIAADQKLEAIVFHSVSSFPLMKAIEHEHEHEHDNEHDFGA